MDIRKAGPVGAQSLYAATLFLGFLEGWPKNSRDRDWRHKLEFMHTVSDRCRASSFARLGCPVNTYSGCGSALPTDAPLAFGQCSLDLFVPS